MQSRSVSGGVLVVIGLLVCATRPSFAFSAAVHEETTKTLCGEAGLPTQFCDRVAIEAASVDGLEWDDLAAHAQLAEGLPLCESANAVITRLVALRDEFRASLAKLAGTPPRRWYEYEGLAARVATAVGRGLHTLQDNHAHLGVSNPEHAWFSLGDECGGAWRSPDDDPAALADARRVTTAALRQVEAEIAQAGVRILLNQYSCKESRAESGSGTPACAPTSSPTPWAVCRYLAEAERWDGIDRRWDITATETGFLEAFLGGARWDMCETTVLYAPPRPTVDISHGAPTCPAIHLLCLGHADEAGTAAGATVPAEVAGCRVARHGDAPAWLALLALAGLPLARWRPRPA